MKRRHIQIGLLFIAVCVLIGLGLALATFKQQDRSPAVAPAAMTTNTVTSMIATETTATAIIPPVQADFLVTDELRNHPPSAAVLAARTKIATFCEGARLTLVNHSTRLLPLGVIAPNSEGAASLGTVQPAATLTFDAGVVGNPEDNRSTLIDADTGKGLIEYIVVDCKGGAAPDASSASSTNVQTADDSYKQGRCRLVVKGRTIIDGACFYTLKGGGDFEITDRRDGTGYLAMLMQSDGEAEGYWSEDRGTNRASDHLGVMTRSGPCWQNADAEMCLWSV